MTLWPFQNVVCFSAPFVRSFVAPRCSTAYCLYFLSLVSLVLFPLFASFITDNVWVKEGSYREQPIVNFAQEIVLVLGGATPDDAVGWASHVHLEPLLPTEVRVPVLRSKAVDRNLDLVPEALHLSLEMPAGQIFRGNGYRRVLLLAVYNLVFRERVQERLSGLVVIDISNPYPAMGVSVHGKLRLKQALPLYLDNTARTVYETSPLAVNWTSNWAAQHTPTTLRNLLERYAERNETIYFDASGPPVWDYSPRDSFLLELQAEVPTQVVYYVPSSLMMLKFAWMQVVSFLIPTWAVLYCVKDYAFSNQLVETYVIPQLPPKDEM